MLISSQRKKITSPKEIANIFQNILAFENDFSKDQEHFWVVGLNQKNVTQYIDLVSLGTVNESIIHPREVFRMAIHKGVVSILVCHNHPSGDLTPSNDDFKAIKRLKEVGDILGIKLIDSLIISSTEYLSFREKKLGELHDS